MVKMTKQEKAVLYFEQILRLPRGKQTSRKYIIFDRPDGLRYYIGKSGAIRIGKTLADSVSITDMRLPEIEQEVNEYLKLHPDTKQDFKKV